MPKIDEWEQKWEAERGSSVATLLEYVKTIRPWPQEGPQEEIRALCSVFVLGWLTACRRAVLYYLGGLGATRIEKARFEKLLRFCEGQIERVGSEKAFTGNWRRG